MNALFLVNFKEKQTALVLTHCIIMFNMRALLNNSHLRPHGVWTAEPQVNWTVAAEALDS